MHLAANRHSPARVVLDSAWAQLSNRHDPEQPYPASLVEIAAAERLLETARTRASNDPQTAAQIATLATLLRHSRERVFVGSVGLTLLLGVILLVRWFHAAPPLPADRLLSLGMGLTAILLYVFSCRPARYLARRREARCLAAHHRFRDPVLAALCALARGSLALPPRPPPPRAGQGPALQETALGPALLFKALALPLCFLALAFIVSYLILPLTVFHLIQNYLAPQVAMRFSRMPTRTPVAGRPA